MTADKRNWVKNPVETAEDLLAYLRRYVNPTLTMEQMRESTKRHREKEAIRKQEEAARRKAKRDAKREQGA